MFHSSFYLAPNPRPCCSRPIKFRDVCPIRWKYRYRFPVQSGDKHKCSLILRAPCGPGLSSNQCPWKQEMQPPTVYMHGQVVFFGAANCTVADVYNQSMIYISLRKARPRRCKIYDCNKKLMLILKVRYVPVLRGAAFLKWGNSTICFPYCKRQLIPAVHQGHNYQATVVVPPWNGPPKYVVPGDSVLHTKWWPPEVNYPPPCDQCSACPTYQLRPQLVKRKCFKLQLCANWVTDTVPFMSQLSCNWIASMIGPYKSKICSNF